MHPPLPPRLQPTRGGAHPFYTDWANTRSMKFIRFFFALSLLAQGVLFSARAAAVAFDDFQYTGNDPQPIAKMGANTYRNPILAGFYPDPSVCRVGNDYYLINSTFAYFPGIPIFHSRDLVNWTQIGNVISRPDQLSYNKLGVSRGIFAPSISYAKGVYYVICTMADAGGNFVVTAANPQGPWSNPTWLEFKGLILRSSLTTMVAHGSSTMAHPPAHRFIVVIVRFGFRNSIPLKRRCLVLGLSWLMEVSILNKSRSGSKDRISINTMAGTSSVVLRGAPAPITRR